MTNTVFNVKKIELAKQPMFFGEKLNVARYDLEKYPVFSKATKMMKSYMWTPEEINLDKDKNDFKNGLSPHERHIFTKNVSYQILMDSINERATVYAFLPWVSVPELEAAIIWWAAFEQIHAQSYQWILQNVFPDPDVVFSAIMDDEQIIARATSIIRYYDDFISYSEAYRVLGPGYHSVFSTTKKIEPTLIPSPYQEGQMSSTFTLENSWKKEIELNEQTLKKKLYLALVSVYALESIRFYVSFACSFAFGQQGKMKGNADIIKLIAKDEAQHMGISINILRNLARKEGGFTDIITECEPEVLAIFDEVVDQEKSWAKYLFKDGSIVGLNEALLCQYVEFIANKRMKSLGLEKRYAGNTDPFGWMSSWLGSEDVQAAPQEKELVDYLIGALNTTVNEDNLIDF
jgi:ribonucleoside-diphosphate reductase beta chain